MDRTAIVSCVAALALPALVGLCAYVWLQHAVIEKYNACVNALPSDALDNRGLRRVVNDLGRLARYAESHWNINAPFDVNAINLLVPTHADAAWHQQCGLPVAPADCLASANGRFVVCNAVIGEQLSNPLLLSGVARPEIERAIEFLGLAVVGHELGHLSVGGANIAHLYPQNMPDGLKCSQADQNSPSEERAADDFGIALACDAIRASAADSQIQDDGSAVRTIMALRDRLDEQYFAFDDTCGGDVTYPSVSRRKSGFTSAYARCLFPGRNLPYADMQSDQDLAFQHLESWLRQRQRTGIVGSALYGTGPTYQYEVAPASENAPFIAFDSSGTDAQVSITVASEKTVAHTVLSAWDTAGTVIDAKEDTRGGATFLASFAARDGGFDVREVSVRCGTDAPCTATQSEKHVATDTEVLGTADHAIVELTPGRLQSYATSLDYLAGKVSVDVGIDLKPDAALVDGTVTRLVIARRLPVDELTSGFIRVGLLESGNLQWSVFMTSPLSVKRLGAVGLYGERVALWFDVERYREDSGAELWVCPFGGLLKGQVAGKVGCDVYDAPPDLTYSIGLANNDLSSLGTKLIRADRCDGLIVARHGGWLWMLDPLTRKQDVLPGDGVIHCAPDRSHALVYRMRRIDDLDLRFGDSRRREGVLARMGK